MLIKWTCENLYFVVVPYYIMQALSGSGPINGLKGIKMRPYMSPPKSVNIPHLFVEKETTKDPIMTSE